MMRACILPTILMFFLARAEGIVDFDGPPIEPAGVSCSFVVEAISDVDDIARREFAKYLAANPGAKPPINFETSGVNHWEVTKADSITSIILVTKGGKRGEVWKNGDVTIMRQPGGRSYYVDHSPARENQFFVKFGRYGYCHGSWISPENYVGKVNYNGVEALYFCDAKPPDKPTYQSKQAWIDFQTRRPLCIREYNVSYVYRHLPSQPIDVPKEVLDGWAREMKGLKPSAIHTPEP